MRFVHPSVTGIVKEAYMNVRDIIPWSRSAQPLARYAETEQNPFLTAK
jgi:hypothetical protein